jgi:hypothetical protein
MEGSNDPRLPLYAATTLIGLLALLFFFNSDTLIRVGSLIFASYVLLVVLLASVCKVRNRTIEFTETVLMAVVVLLLTVPVSAALNQDATTLFDLLVTHFQVGVPLTGMGILGAARRRKEYIVSLAYIFSYPSWKLIYRFTVVQEFDPFHTTPFKLVTGVAFWQVVTMATGALLLYISFRISATE